MARGWDYDGTLQDTTTGSSVNFNFARYITVNAGVNRVMERYREINFDKTQFSLSGIVNTSRRIWFSAEVNSGDEIRFVANPYLGSNTSYGFSMTLLPFSRLKSELNLDTNRFMDVRSNTEVFNVKILHAVTTYQFTDRLLVRSILDHNTLDKTLAANFLMTYRVNAGTVFFVGYNERQQHGDLINPLAFPAGTYQRTNRAIFTKLQYLFRQ